MRGNSSGRKEGKALQSGAMACTRYRSGESWAMTWDQSMVCMEVVMEVETEK